MRHCRGCDTTKPLDEFHNDKRLPLGKSYLCKPCGRAKKRNNEIRKAYGITQSQYEEMLVKQNSACAVCKATETGIERTTRFSIDHFHKTGNVRGLLCNWCNQGLGMFKDDIELLKKAIDYLEV